MLPWEQAVKDGQQGLLSDGVMADRMDIYALCLEMIDTPKLPGARHV